VAASRTACIVLHLPFRPYKRTMCGALPSDVAFLLATMQRLQLGYDFSSITGGSRSWSWEHLPSLPFRSFLHALRFPSPSLPSFISHLPLPVFQLWRREEHCKLLHQGPGCIAGQQQPILDHFDSWKHVCSDNRFSKPALTRCVL